MKKDLTQVDIDKINALKVDEICETSCGFKIACRADVGGEGCKGNSCIGSKVKDSCHRLNCSNKTTKNNRLCFIYYEVLK